MQIPGSLRFLHIPVPEHHPVTEQFQSEPRAQEMLQHMKQQFKRMIGVGKHRKRNAAHLSADGRLPTLLHTVFHILVRMIVVERFRQNRVQLDLEAIVRIKYHMVQGMLAFRDDKACPFQNRNRLLCHLHIRKQQIDISAFAKLRHGIQPGRCHPLQNQDRNPFLLQNRLKFFRPARSGSKQNDNITISYRAKLSGLLICHLKGSIKFPYLMGDSSSLLPSCRKPGFLILSDHEIFRPIGVRSRIFRPGLRFGKHGPLVKCCLLIIVNTTKLRPHHP